ncbi:MAG: response regulator [Candidatus Hydrogenedentes bacterium]|nr:response regulator [Candidatus Hydrogenedentota bacterium]
MRALYYRTSQLTSRSSARLAPGARGAAASLSRTLLVPLAIAFLLAEEALAQTTYPIRHYTPENGLAGAVVRAIERTPDGVMWFGCWGRGVSSYDGLNWASFGLEQGLPSLDVRALCLDPTGQLWAGTAGGIARWTGENWEAVQTGIEGIDPAPVFTAIAHTDGSVWFGLKGGRVLVHEPRSDADSGGRWSIRLDARPEAEPSAVRAIYRRSGGQILVGGDSVPLSRWRDGAWSQEPGDNLPKRIKAIAETTGGVLYAGSDDGLWRRAPEESAWTLVTAGPVAALAPLPNNRLLVGRREKVVIRGPEREDPIELMKDGTVLPIQALWSGGVPEEIWIGTKLGVFRLSPFGWTQYESSGDGAPLGGPALYADPETPATTVDVSGNILRFEDGGWRAVGRLPEGAYSAISSGSERTLWFVKAGLAIQWDPETATERRRIGLPPGISRILQSRAGPLFAHGPRSFLRHSADAWIETPLKPREPVEQLATVLETRSGQLLVSTLIALELWDIGAGGDLNRVFRHESEANFRGFIEDPDGSVLVGANEDGIYRLRDGALAMEIPFPKDPGARVATMHRAPDGKLWTGALELGISCYYKGRWQWFGPRWGLPSGGVHVIASDPDGVVWAAMHDGRLLRYMQSPGTPQTRIRQAPVEIPHDQRAVFQFDARDPWDVTAPEDLLYSWRIRPADAENGAPWAPLSRERSIITPHLASGSYVLEVRAADTDFNLDPTPAQAAFAVLPPLWATPGFLLPVGLLAAASLFSAALLYRKYTQLQLSEADLREAKDQAEAASRAKSQFLAHISHEIRTPMNAILGHVQVMQDTENRTPEDEANLGIIARSGDHLLELLDNVLEMARIEAGQVVVNPSEFDIRETVSGLIQMFQIPCKSRNLVLASEIADSVPQCIVADQGKLRQILINLIGNAIKFTEDGSVTLSVRAEESPGAPGARTLELVVVDTGHGIDPNAIERIFEPFEQAAPARNRGGAGLGLPICRRHVEAMGGTIELTSDPGQGAVVTVRIPVRAGTAEHPQPGAAPAPEARPAGGPPVRVLVVDDIETNLSLMEKMLARRGFDVVAVPGGAEAVEEFTRRRPDLILMDRAMPGIDGIEATRRIRALEGGGEIPIIFVTGGALDEEWREIMASGATDVLRKPFRQAELFARIAKYLDTRSGV